MISIEPIQVIAIIVALFAVSRAFLRLREHKISVPAFIFWAIVWIAVVIVASIPDITFYFSKLIGISRGMDVVVYFSILLLFYLVFRIYVKLEALDNNITKLTRTIAIQRKNKK
ncbi:MAG: DUF2304 family protein [Candidatus Woesearchaeota archaeon]